MNQDTHAARPSQRMSEVSSLSGPHTVWTSPASKLLDARNNYVKSRLFQSICKSSSILQMAHYTLVTESLTCVTLNNLLVQYSYNISCWYWAVNSSLKSKFPPTSPPLCQGPIEVLPNVQLSHRRHSSISGSRSRHCFICLELWVFCFV